MSEDYVLIAGSASQALAGAAADYLDHPLAASETLRFSDGNLFVRVLENVRGRDAFVLQAVAPPTNDNFMELLFWVDALKRASATSVTAVIPYFSYAKGDKKDEPRVSIRARVCADALEAAGVDRVVTLDLHAPQVQGFFKVPVDDLRAAPVLCEAVGSKVGAEGLVVVAPDAGFAKKARDYATRLGVSLAIADKRRADHNEAAEVTELMGDVEGRVALVVDDFTISAGTLIDAARVLLERGATTVLAAVSQALLTPEACHRLDDSPIERLYTTDAVPIETVSSKLEIVSVAPLFGEAIRRISRRESISILFN
jgi:ribose-phosphate pyrophosphokinase